MRNVLYAREKNRNGDENIVFFSIIAIVIFIDPLPSQSGDIPVPRSADISISGIFLGDSESARVVIGKDVDMMDTSVVMPRIKVTNRNETEMMVLIFHPGSILGSFNEVNVRKKVDTDFNQISKLSSVDHFITGKNIRLGMTPKELTDMLGKPDEMKKNKGSIEYKYKIDDFDKSEFLKHYNLPYYYGEYVFTDDMLVEFKFGFTYP